MIKKINIFLVAALLMTATTVGTYAQNAQRAPRHNNFHNAPAAKQGENALTGKTVQFDNRNGNMPYPHSGVMKATSSVDYKDIGYSTTVTTDGTPATGTVTAAANTFTYVWGGDVTGKGFSFYTTSGKNYLISITFTSTTGTFDDSAGMMIFDNAWNWIWGMWNSNGQSVINVTGIYNAGVSGYEPFYIFDENLNDYSYSIKIKELNAVSYTDIDYPLISVGTPVTGSFNSTDNALDIDGDITIGKGYTLIVQTGKWYKITAHLHSAQPVWAYPEAGILTGGALQGNSDDWMYWTYAQDYPYGTDFDFFGFFSGKGNSAVRILLYDWDLNDLSYTFTIEEMPAAIPSYAALAYPSIAVGAAKTGVLNSTDKLYVDQWDNVANGEGFTFPVQAGKTYNITCTYFSQDSVYLNSGFALLTGGTLLGDGSDWYNWTNNGYYDNQLNLSMTYNASADGTMRLLLNDWSYNNLIYSIKVTESPVAPTTAVTLSQFLDATTRTITYSNNLLYADNGYTNDLVQGSSIFRYSSSDFYAVAYKISMPSGGEIQIHSAKEWDSYLYVYQSNGAGSYTQRASNDDAGGYWGGYNNTSYIDFIAPAAGDYYIVVTDYQPNRPGNYLLKVWNNSTDEPNLVINSISASQSSITATATATTAEVRSMLSALAITGSVNGGLSIEMVNNPYIWTIHNSTATFMPAAPDGYEFASTVQPITVQINGWTGINDINFSAINAWTINGALYVSGLSAGERYSIYTVSGVCLAQGTAVSGDAQYLATLPMRGVYILQTSHGAVKVLN